MDQSNESTDRQSESLVAPVEPSQSAHPPRPAEDVYAGMAGPFPSLEELGGKATKTPWGVEVDLTQMPNPVVSSTGPSSDPALTSAGHSVNAASNAAEHHADPAMTTAEQSPNPVMIASEQPDPSSAPCPVYAPSFPSQTPSAPPYASQLDDRRQPLLSAFSQADSGQPTETRSDQASSSLGIAIPSATLAAGPGIPPSSAVPQNVAISSPVATPVAKLPIAEHLSIGQITDSERPTRGGGRRGRGIRHVASPSTRGRGNTRGRGRGSRGGRVSTTGRGRGIAKQQSSFRPQTDDMDSDPSENMTLLPPQSRSGRKIFQASGQQIATPDRPLAYTTPSAWSTQSKEHSRINGRGGGDPTRAGRGGGGSRGSVRGRGRGRGRGRKGSSGIGALCRHCGRSHGPESNAIVFCDSCNQPWHQYCHDPPIAGTIMQLAAAEWLCSDCSVLREEQPRVLGRVSGQGLNLSEKRQLLRAQSTEHLIALLLQASALHPDLPLLDPQGKEARLDELMGDSIFPFPRAGNGLTLRMESDEEDLALLLDDDYDVFSHRCSGMG